MTDREMRFKILRAIYNEMKANPEGYGLFIDELSRLVPADYKFNLRYLTERDGLKIPSAT